MSDMPGTLRAIRDVLRSGACGQRQVWEEQLETAAVKIELLQAELERRERILVESGLRDRAEIERLRAELALERRRLTTSEEARTELADALTKKDAWNDRYDDLVKRIRRLHGQLAYLLEETRAQFAEIKRLREMHPDAVHPEGWDQADGND